MSDEHSYDAGNEGKEDFASIYNRAEPSPYYASLGKLGYRIPMEAKPVFQRVIDARRAAADGERVTMLDLGCSYGINAALLKYDMDMESLYDWYDERPSGSATRAVALDRAFFAKREAQTELSVIGVDPADRALEYAVGAGLLDDSISSDLETNPVPDDAAAKLREVDVITATGSIGYVSERTFQHILPAIDAGRSPWVATFVLRMFPYDEIERTLSSFGLVTEKLEGRHFAQRGFADSEERDHVLARLDSMGLDPSPETTAGGYLAEFFLSRPAEETRRQPVQDLMADLS